MEDKIIGFKINSKGYGTIPKLLTQDRTICIGAKGLYAYFCSYTGGGDTCFPTRKKVCFDLCISIDTFGKYLKQLVERGYVKVEQVKENGRFSHNVYTLCDTILPCTEISDTEISVYEKTDTNNNSNNNNSNKKESKKEERENFEVLKRELEKQGYSLQGYKMLENGENIEPQNLRFEPQMVKDRISKFEIQNSEFEIQGSKFEEQYQRLQTEITNKDYIQERKKERGAEVEEKPKEENKKSFDEIIDGYTENAELRKELKEHLKIRKSKKAPLTNRVIELSLNELDRIAKTDRQKIKIVQKAIIRGWTSFFPLTHEDTIPTKNKSYDVNDLEYDIFDDD